jgi:3-oxosteroid 1-dehydrogenase
VLNEDDKPIEAFYAAGNCTASIMGDKYPGAGCTIGPALTMAYRAANHAMGLEA